MQNPHFISYTRSSDLAVFLTRVAGAYGVLTHTPEATDVQDAYRALCSALDAQYTVLSAYVRIDYVDRDPYSDSHGMFLDIENYEHLSVYRFAEFPVGHAFAVISPVHGLSYNLIFRAVHDGLAHYPDRLPFSFGGEFWAFRAHADLMTGNGLAIRALATETLGQNAWYNFGPSSHLKPRPFVEQKAALLPESLITRALLERYGARCLDARLRS